MTATKSIFEKTYMTASQAEAAAVKAMGTTWVDAHEVVPSGKRFAVAPKAVQPAAEVALKVPTLVVLAEQKKVAALEVVAKALDALHQIEKTVHDVAENLTLAQALAESGETLADLKDDEGKPAKALEGGLHGCGHDNCPSCGIGLDNGLMDWDSLVEQHGSKARDMQQHQWSCMGCGAEWGVKRAGINIQKDRAEQNGVTRPSEGGVCASIWAECDKRATSGVVPPVKDMKAWALTQGVDQTTCLIQYYQWRKFNGVVGRAKEMPAK